MLIQLKDKNIAFQLHIFCAFSRDGPKKIYVQHILAREQAQIWKYIGEENGCFYVCGYTCLNFRDARHMAHDVHQVMAKIGCDYGGYTEDVWVKELKDSGRYLEDVWA